MHRHILIPTDGSGLSQEAIAYGVALAKSVNAKITVVTVTAPFSAFAIDADALSETPEHYQKRMAVRAQKYLDASTKIAASAGVTVETMHVEDDQPYRAIIETAAQKLCDLIVMASHGRRGFSAVLLGSETVKVLTHGTIPVLVVRPRHSGLFQPLTELT
jgi:nucleotide-binding universal stress UspA family protein